MMQASEIERLQKLVEEAAKVADAGEQEANEEREHASIIDETFSETYYQNGRRDALEEAAAVATDYANDMNGGLIADMMDRTFSNPDGDGKNIQRTAMWTAASDISLKIRSLIDRKDTK